MTNNQIIQIKEYVRGAFPNMKDNDFADVVWFDLLKDEEFYGILQSVKNFVRDGSKFPPTVGEIIKGYELIVRDFSDSILREMEEDGYFDDVKKTNDEIMSGRCYKCGAELEIGCISELCSSCNNLFSLKCEFKEVEKLETADWNKRNRKTKAFLWVSGEIKAPKWFTRDYKEYELRKKKQIFNKTKRLN